MSDPGVEVAVLARRLPCARARLVRLVAAAVHAAATSRRRRPPALSVALVGERRMRRLHQLYSGDGSATDVLAFELAGGPRGARGGGVRGEVVVSVPMAFREARARGIGPLTELLLYVVHGTLHLLGEADGTPQAALRMRFLEADALAALGYPLPPSHLESDQHEAPQRGRRRASGV